MMSETQTIVFICEHGAAKSIVAASFFNELADEMGLNLKAVARGTHPDQVLSETAVSGLLEDGLHPTEAVPQLLLPEDARTARRIVSFCDLPEEYKQMGEVEQWDGVPPISADYGKARDAILEKLNHLLAATDW